MYMKLKNIVLDRRDFQHLVYLYNVSESNLKYIGAAYDLYTDVFYI